MKKIITLAERKFGKEFGNYWLGPTFSANKRIQQITDDYKLAFLKKFYSLPPSFINPINKDKTYRKLPDDLIVSVKRDGSYFTYVYDIHSEPVSVFCNSPNARILYNLPVNRELEQRIPKINENKLGSLKELLNEIIGENIFKNFKTIHKIVLAGELFSNVEKENDRPRVYDLVKVMFNPESLKELEAIHFDIFDIISINGNSLITLPYKKRLDICKLLFSINDENKANIIEHKTKVKSKDTYKLYERWVQKKHHEGIVIHTKYNMSYKIKPIFNIDAVIIGFVELLKESLLEGDEGAISSLLLALMHEDGSFQELCRMGGGLSYEQRVELFNLLKQDVVKSSFRASKQDGRAFRFVIPKYIVQVDYMDYIIEDSKGKSIQRMNLKFEDNKWIPIKSIPFVSLISPRYGVMRSEIDKEKYPSLAYVNPKEVRYEDVKCKQILDLVPIDLIGSQEVLENLPKSKILFKVVFEGEWTGYKSGRKIILWQTNKKDLNPSFPNYIVYYGNYSYTRRSPLEQRIYPFNSLDKAIDHINWVFKRPDSNQKGLINKSGNGLKRSINTPPFELLIDKGHKEKIISGLDFLIKKILFNEEFKVDLDLDDLDFDFEELEMEEQENQEIDNEVEKDLLDKMLETDLDDIDFEDL
jgi:hypothetical protein